MGGILVCGLGQVGFRVSLLLLALGEEVTVLTTEASPEWAQVLDAAGANVLIGDAQNAGELKRAGLYEAKCLIGCCNVDLINIQIAFEARKARPDLRIVLRFFDQNLARHVVEKLGVEAALGMAALSGPCFAASTLGEDLVAAIEIDGERCDVARAMVTKRSQLDGLTVKDVRQRFGLEVLTWFRDTGLEIIPSDDIVLQEGDCVKLLGTDDAVQGIYDREQSDEPKPHHTILSWITALSPIPIGKFLIGLWKGSSKELKAVFVSMIVLVLVSFLIIDKFTMVTDPITNVKTRISPLDAFYFVVTTITTTGYGDITLKGQSALVVWYGIFLMLLGSFIFAALYSLITDYLVNARLQQLLGNKRIPEKGHIVLVGLGIVGYRVLEELNRRKAPVVVVEQNPSSKFLGSARTRASVIIGDARDEETLAAAGVPSARAVLACTGDDAMNLSVGLAARVISSKPTRVLRIFDADLADKVEQAFDIDVAMSASKLAAPHFVANAVFGKCGAAFVARGRLFGIDVKAEQSGSGCQEFWGRVRLDRTERTVRICIREMSEELKSVAGVDIWREIEQSSERVSVVSSA